MTPPPSPELTERRYVYNGNDGAQQHEVATRGNRPVKRRKQSPFNVIAVVVMVSLLIVVYVWLKISVNQLFDEVAALNALYKTTQDANEVLRADINKKSTLDRIGKVATEQLAMVAAKEQPRAFEVDADQMARLTEE
jgi:cell division protein FtsL